MAKQPPVTQTALGPMVIAACEQHLPWAEREQVGNREYLARYVRPAGRDLPVSEIERFVYGEKV